ncbi:myb family transcription factor PHL7-like [Papaver somniferum]|uniref:myb family transcription factor PHL7-like n=1 Tax=Papaver somniferum TaxID=3469 RepID=UPI000E701264|nr:myb family transcription factor PHL7-like [Papaver somniferum]XP_026393044.1 myb family transcription factor PHL7-like [Papaver somniferum]
MSSDNYGNNTNSDLGIASSRKRLRWTDELHERFEEAVAQLGGPDKATPKGVLSVMGVQSLTIYHIKSHLQKYRLSKYLPESTPDGKRTDRNDSDDKFTCSDGTPGMQITEALKLQMEVQKRLHEQLEVQRQLQLRIEAQGKYLKRIIDEQQRLSSVLAESPSCSGVTFPMSSGDHNCPESDNNRTDPSTPAATSENKAVKTEMLEKKLALKECLSSLHEPWTPDSGCFAGGSPSESPRDERVKKQRVNVGEALNTKPETAVTHPILESNPGTILKMPPPLEIPASGHSASHSGTSPYDEKRSEEATKSLE